MSSLSTTGDRATATPPTVATPATTSCPTTSPSAPEEELLGGLGDMVPPGVGLHAGQRPRPVVATVLENVAEEIILNIFSRAD